MVGSHIYCPNRPISTIPQKNHRTIKQQNRAIFDSLKRTMRGKYAVHDPQFMHGSPNRMQSGGTAEKVVIDLTDGYSLLNTGLYSTNLTTYSNSMKRRFALPGADEGDQPDDYLTRSERPRKKGWSSRDQLQSQVSAPASAQQQLLQSRVKQPGANCKQPHPTITMAQAHNIYK